MFEDMLGIKENSDDLGITDEDIDLFYADHESNRHWQDRMCHEAYEWQISGVLEMWGVINLELALAVLAVSQSPQNQGSLNSGSLILSP